MPRRLRRAEVAMSPGRPRDRGWESPLTRYPRLAAPSPRRAGGDLCRHIAEGQVFQVRAE